MINTYQKKVTMDIEDLCCSNLIQSTLFPLLGAVYRQSIFNKKRLSKGIIKIRQKVCVDFGLAPSLSEENKVSIQESLDRITLFYLGLI